MESAQALCCHRTDSKTRPVVRALETRGPVFLVGPLSPGMRQNGLSCSAGGFTLWCSRRGLSPSLLSFAPYLLSPPAPPPPLFFPLFFFLNDPQVLTPLYVYWGLICFTFTSFCIPKIQKPCFQCYRIEYCHIKLLFLCFNCSYLSA